MAEIKIQEEVIKTLDAKGWKTARDFYYWSLAAGAEDAFDVILEDWGESAKYHEDLI